MQNHFTLHLHNYLRFKTTSWSRIGRLLLQDNKNHQNHRFNYQHDINMVHTMNFMLPVPDASVPAVEICSLRSAAGMIFSARVTR